MSGLPESNYPAFNRAAEHIAAMGYAVENPAENPEPACKSWAGYMRLALAQLINLNGQHGGIIHARKNMIVSDYLGGFCQRG